MSRRNLVIVLGDQLNADSAAFDDFDLNQDAVWMAEVVAESTTVWAHKARIVMFLSAMRHFRDRLRDQGFEVIQFGPADRDDYPRTVIVDYTGKTYALVVLTEIFNVADENIRQSPNLKSDVDIRVIIGADFQLPEEAQASEFTAADSFISYPNP